MIAAHAKLWSDASPGEMTSEKIPVVVLSKVVVLIKAPKVSEEPRMN